MIKFKNPKENEQFISIQVTDGTDILTVKEHICDRYESIIGHIYDFDRDEILLDTPSEYGVSLYNFSLKALTETVAEVAKANITIFAVRLNKSPQRYRRKTFVQC